MAQIASTKQTQSAEKRGQILAAALALFAAQGFEATTVPQVAKGAGVAAGTIYLYFSSKEALVNELFRHWKANLLEKLSGRVQAEGAAQEQFAAVWEGLGRFHQEAPVAFSFLEMHNHSPYLDEKSLALEARVYDFGRDLVRSFSEVLKPLPADAVIALVWGAFVNLVKESDRGRFSLTAAVMGGVRDVLWQGLKR